MTENYLEIPTTFKHGTMEIRLGGSVSLDLGVNTSTQWRYVKNAPDETPGTDSQRTIARSPQHHGRLPSPFTRRRAA